MNADGQEKKENKKINCGARKGNHQFFERIMAHFFEACDSAHGVNGNIAGLDAKKSGSKSMSKFMQDDTEKNCEK